MMRAIKKQKTRAAQACRGWLWLALLAFAAGPAVAALPPNVPVPGGVAVVALDGEQAAPANVQFADRRVMVLTEGGKWFAVVGIPLDVAPGRYTVVAKQANGELREYPLEIGEKAYRSQRLTVKNKNQVEPSAEELRRIATERDTLLAAFAAWSDTAPELNLDLPTQGRLSSEFGLRRFFNDQPSKPHGGIDLAAPMGTPISAPAPGKVIAVGDFFFNGNTVLMDHGQGMVSMFCHLRNTAVTPGQTLARGERLGTVGASGRATGPHLHWTVSLNGSAIDPMLLLTPEARARLSAGPAPAARKR